MTDKILVEAFDKMKAIEESEDPFCIGATGDTPIQEYTEVKEGYDDDLISEEFNSVVNHLTDAHSELQHLISSGVLGRHTKGAEGIAETIANLTIDVGSIDNAVTGNEGNY